MAYVIGIDQSTQGTKVLLFDGNGNIMYRADRPHRQIINDRGWVSHDMEEVYANLINGVRELLEQTGVDDKKIAAVGISNQRETTVAWGKDGKPLAPAEVWQCGRAKGIVEELGREEAGREGRGGGGMGWKAWRTGLGARGQERLACRKAKNVMTAFFCQPYPMGIFMML